MTFLNGVDFFALWFKAIFPFLQRVSSSHIKFNGKIWRCWAIHKFKESRTVISVHHTRLPIGVVKISTMDCLRRSRPVSSFSDLPFIPRMIYPAKTVWMPSRVFELHKMGSTNMTNRFTIGVKRAWTFSEHAPKINGMRWCIGERMHGPFILLAVNGFTLNKHIIACSNARSWWMAAVADAFIIESYFSWHIIHSNQFVELWAWYCLCSSQGLIHLHSALAYLLLQEWRLSDVLFCRKAFYSHLEKPKWHLFVLINSWDHNTLRHSSWWR